MLASNRELAAKVMQLNRRVDDQNAAIHSIVAAIQRLMKPAVKRIPRIGFRSSTMQK